MLIASPYSSAHQENESHICSVGVLTRSSRSATNVTLALAALINSRIHIKEQAHVLNLHYLFMIINMMNLWSRILSVCLIQLTVWLGYFTRLHKEWWSVTILDIYKLRLNDISGLVVGDIGYYHSERDIIIEILAGTLQRISRLDQKIISFQYSLLFPSGEDGNQTNISFTNQDDQVSRKR